jgi:beta-xylosidase
LPNATQTFAEESYHQTLTAEVEQMTQEIIESTQQNIEHATQTSVAAVQESESMAQTATAIAPILEQMGTDFEDENSLPDAMYIAREDPSRWDLTSKSGWLHIKGRYVSHSDEDWITKNVFVYPLEYTNISIIARVDADMFRDNQSVWLALSPSTYKTVGYTVELGIALDSNEGREVYAWGCDSDSCGSNSMDYKFDDQIQFSGPVYLRLDIQGLSYTFYFSENGVDWIYLGNIDGFSAGDNLILAAGGGNSWYKEDEFDAYFDLLYFKPISSD